MLASSMMLVSISEETPAQNVGYQSRLCCSSANTSNSRIGSGDSLSGWGSHATRKSCKMDLCAMMTDSNDDQSQQQVPALPYPNNMMTQSSGNSSSSTCDQDWGFFDANDF